MLYFFNFRKNILKVTFKKNILDKRIHRKSNLRIWGSKNFVVGDVLVVIFRVKDIIYIFEGICISLKKKSIKLPNVSLILRSVIFGVGVELTILYFFYRIYFSRIGNV